MKTKEILKRLKEARTAATLERCAFNNISEDPRGPAMFNGAPLTAGRVNDFIRERTRIYRDTWILPALDEAIKLIEEGRS